VGRMEGRGLEAGVRPKNMVVVLMIRRCRTFVTCSRCEKLENNNAGNATK
jgi:hypothetical protein